MKSKGKIYAPVDLIHRKEQERKATKKFRKGRISTTFLDDLLTLLKKWRV